MASQVLQESIYTQPSTVSAVEFNYTNTPLFSPEEFLSMEYDAGLPEQLSIGGLSSASVKIKISGSKNLLNKKIRVNLSTGEISMGNYNSEHMGWFTVTENEQDGENTTITGFDGAYLLNRKYLPNVAKEAAGYSTTKIVADILDQCTDAERYKGATLKPERPALTNQYINQEITGYTCAEMIGYVAALNGQNALINGEGKLKFVSLEEMTLYLPGGLRVLTSDYVYEDSLKIGGLWRPAGIVCQVSEEEKLFAPVVDGGEFNLYIRNPFMTQSALNAAAARLTGLVGYRVGQCAHFGGGFVRPCDVVPIRTADGTEYRMIAAGVHIACDGGVRTEFSSSYAADDSEASVGSGVGTSSGDLLSQVNSLEQKVKELETGSSNWQALSLASGVTSYSDQFGGSPLGVPAFCVQGGICRLTGSVQVTYGGSTVTLATLPETVRPVSNVYRLSPCGGKRIARVYVNLAGEVRLEWLLNLTDGSNYTTATWVQVNLEFPVIRQETLAVRALVEEGLQAQVGEDGEALT